MASFGRIFKNRKSIIKDFYSLIDEAEENREIEEKAAIMIQKHWRSFYTRKQNAILNYNATKIQSTWRMYASILQVQVLRSRKATIEREDFYNEAATKIQRLWRGYLTRTQVFDYYKQQNFLIQQALKNAEMAQMLENYNAQTNDYAEEQVFNQNMELQQKYALQNHHLIATQAIPSIFSPRGFTKDQESLPAIENYIKTINKSKIVIPALSPRSQI